MNPEMIITGFLFGIGFGIAQAIVSACLNLLSRRTAP
jgi:hypothetical protein